ncbi:trimethylamine---corrinoid protein Co-methyltransferase [Desulforhopalus singaporensis]|uniref:Trimethylamine---corrinoid protein Co-methyltransferase n=1 Tax=Desulforhopalus singaporensis TaxID=91360 RepID=A0A1H0TB19_9BACT|nr:trimethylamine---corrinoid protein Co-methyltransferase [Desulforhopalus singaporensis]
MRRNSRPRMLGSGGFGFSPFTQDEYDAIHEATMEILWDHGIYVGHEEALELFYSAGATVDKKSGMVRIPSWLLNDLIKAAPDNFVLHARNPENDYVIGGNRVGFINFGEAVKYRDPYTGELREPTKKDLGDVVRVTDYLEQIDFHHRAMVSGDKPPLASSLHNWDAIASNTDKHFFLGPVSSYHIKRMVEMGIAVSGSEEEFRKRPFFMVGTCPVSPLRLTEEFCDMIMEGARQDLPLMILSMALSGGSSSVHLAGTLVSHNVEVLSGIALAQLVKKGARCFYGSSTTAMDLRFGSAAVGSPEAALIGAGTAGLAKYYNLPSYISGG